MNKRSLETEINFIAEECFKDYFIKDEANFNVIDEETFKVRMKSFVEVLINTLERTYSTATTSRNDIGSENELREENERLKMALADLELAFILQSQGVYGSKLVRELSDREKDIHDVLMERVQRIEEKEFDEEMDE